MIKRYNSFCYEVKSRFGFWGGSFIHEVKRLESEACGGHVENPFDSNHKKTSSNKTSCIRSWHGQIRAAALLVELLGSRLHLTKVGLKMI